VPTFGELRSLVLAVSWYLLISACVWLIYLALEPAVRRRWPETLVSWSRIMAGHYSDPLVGRDLLYGMVFGIVLAFLWCLGQYVGAKYGLVPGMPRLDFISSPVDFVGGVLDSLIKSAALSLLAFFLVSALRALLRSQWLAAAAFVLIFTTVALLRSPEFTPNLLLLPVGQLVIFTVLTRYGLVTMIAAGFVEELLLRAPLTADLTAWYATHGLAAAFVVATIATFGFKIALAGRPLLRRDFLDS
jgi:serine/threonine-protein kinase